MKKLVRTSAVALTALFLLSGCALVGQMSGGETPEVETTSTSESTPGAPGETTPSESSDPGAFAVSYACRMADTRTFAEAPSDLAEIWALGDDVTRCTGKSNGGTTFSETEQKALDALGQAATDDDKDVAPDDVRLADVYALCATPGFYFAISPGISTDEQSSQLEAALILCPEHPDAESARTSLNTYEANVTAGNDGTRFNDGVWKVGDEIKPGTYKPETPSDNCRWFRYDDKGEWIETSYDKTQAEIVVTIDAKDSTFESRNCGYWRAS
ncbi:MULTISPECIES: hypothetical protein [unclassified Pseudoclavibacter]|uniref:hypothetical protein n=1 Tax=unclassified Pseudoclavibacter TaxID=2615177 RepID=UPI000CE778DC|nr:MULTISPECIES: hypothetical protein [unclassified Pseudoclavibacter]MBS3180272.1 hypothetical protein [Pseudoclavibacter sp. Marseille-Q4354]PPG28079.1 hypothetical protein C5B97_14485 [Pseudoclavibacter sp. RFBB5]